MGRQHQAVLESFTTIHAAYAAALERAPLDGDTRRAYDSRVRTFLAWLEASGLDGDPFTDAHDRDFAVRVYDLFVDSWKGYLAGARKPLPDDELESLVRLIVAMLDGLCLQLFTHGDEKRVLREAETAEALVTAYLVRRSRR